MAHNKKNKSLKKKKIRNLKKKTRRKIKKIIKKRKISIKRNVKQKGASHVVKKESSLNTNWANNIDVVIPWAGEDDETVGLNIDIRSRDNGEMKYILRSIAKNAPWVRNVWIVLDGDYNIEKLDVPKSIKQRTNVVNRCTYMPLGTCPTQNSFVVEAFSYLLPDLSEHFVLAHDDIFLGRAITPQHLYKDGKPYVWRKGPTWGPFSGTEFHRLYDDPKVVNFTTPLSTAPVPHFWCPQLKSVCASMHSQYPEFYNFLGSHYERYSSIHKGYNKSYNSQEEDPKGFFMWELLRTRKGVYKNLNSQRSVWWDEVVISQEGFKKALHTKPIFMNINDNFSLNPILYKTQHNWFHEFLNSMYPNPDLQS